jgi:hypothetical protein
MKMNEIKLQPNCSEVVWRLNIEEGLSTKERICLHLNPLKIDEEGYSQSDGDEMPFDVMVHDIQDAMKHGIEPDKIWFEVIENTGGSSQDMLEDCFDVALQYCKCKITKDKALKKIKKIEDEDE